MKRIGLIINPIAGMGGSVGLKGTDGKDILDKAKSLGAVPKANEKTKRALVGLSDSEMTVVTAPGDMGEKVCQEVGLNYEVLEMEVGSETTPEDTIKAIELMKEADVSVVVFSGGDGTARLFAEHLGDAIPVIGIPAGVKIHSSVYAIRPELAGEMIYRIVTSDDDFETNQSDVMDIDEELFREGVVSAKLYGHLLTPSFEEFQRTKATGVVSEKSATEDIAATIVAEMEEGMTYFIGPGSTTVAIMEELELPYTLLGFDIVRDKKIIKNDASEADLLKEKDPGNTKVILSIIGGQGYLIGRGNQQLSPKVLEGMTKEDIQMVATSDKLQRLDRRPLLIDSGSPEIDEMLKGYHKILIGNARYKIYKAE